MTVSFIVTSYNYSDYILETIKSIKNQEIKNFEIIVVDDCSTDNSNSILDVVDGIKLIKHKTNKGQLAAILTGLKEARGEYVSIIDSDDTIDRNYLEIMTNALKKNNIALVTCNSKENKILTTKNAPFGGWYWAPMSCGMFKRKSLNCILNYNNTEKWKICPDKFLFNLAHLINGSMLITDNLVNKREHERNAGKVKNRFLINIKNNFCIRHEALKIIKDKELRQLILNSYPYIFNQIFKKLMK